MITVDDADGLVEPSLASDASEPHHIPDGGRVEHACEEDIDGGGERLEEHATV